MFDKNFFSTPLSSTCFWIRDPGSGMGKNQDPGSGITSRIRNTACKMFGPFKSSILVYIIAYHQPWVKVMLILVAVAAVAVLQTKTYLESVVGNPPAWPLILKENKLFSWSVEISLGHGFFLNLVPVVYIRLSRIRIASLIRIFLLVPNRGRFK